MKNEMNIKRWMAMPKSVNAQLSLRGMVDWAHYNAHAKSVSEHICRITACLTPDKYIMRTHAWRPLDIHPDYLVWEGAQTNKKGK